MLYRRQHVSRDDFSDPEQVVGGHTKSSFASSSKSRLRSMSGSTSGNVSRS